MHHCYPPTSRASPRDAAENTSGPAGCPQGSKWEGRGCYLPLTWGRERMPSASDLGQAARPIAVPPKNHLPLSTARWGLKKIITPRTAACRSSRKGCCQRHHRTHPAPKQLSLERTPVTSDSHSPFPITLVNCPGRSPSGKGAPPDSPSHPGKWCCCIPPAAESLQSEPWLSEPMREEG